MKIKKLKKRWYVLFLSLLIMIVGVATYALTMSEEATKLGYKVSVDKVSYYTNPKIVEGTNSWLRNADKINGTYLNKDVAVYCLQHKRATPISANYKEIAGSSINAAVYLAMSASIDELGINAIERNDNHNGDREYLVRQLLVWYCTDGLSSESGLNNAPACKGKNGGTYASNFSKSFNPNASGTSQGIEVYPSDDGISEAFLSGIKHLRHLLDKYADGSELNWNPSTYEASALNTTYNVVTGLKVNSNLNFSDTNIQVYATYKGVRDDSIKFRMNPNDGVNINTVNPDTNFCVLIPGKYVASDVQLVAETHNAKKVSGKAYYTDDGDYQEIAKAEFKPVDRTATARITGNQPTINIVKTDEAGNKLAGAVFEIYKMYKIENAPANSGRWTDPLDNVEYAITYVTKVRTQSDTSALGTAKFTAEQNVRYMVKEVQAPAGYKLPSGTDQCQSTYLQIGQTNTVTFVDKKDDSAKLYIKKVSAESLKQAQNGEISEDDVERLEGAEFTVEDITAVDADNTGLTGKTFTTNSNGVISCNVKAGHTYKVTETKAPKGYVLPKDNSQTITIKEDTKVGIVTFADEKVKGTLMIKKTNRKTGQALNGVEFTLYTKSGAKVVSGLTNKVGQLYFDNLDLGTYILKETKALEGFIIPQELKNGVEVEIKADDADNTFEYTATNERITGKVKFAKYDNETGKLIGGATYGLYSDAACTNLVQELKAEAGKVSAESKELDYGTYYVKELKAPKGYEMSYKVTPVKIDGKSNNNIYTVGVTDNAKRILLRLFKKDSKEEKYLAGAKFQLYEIGEDGSESLISYKDESWVLQDTFITNSEGYLEFPAWLKYGDYKLVEVEAPEGYNKINDITIHLNENTKINSVGVTSVTVDNDKILGNIKLTKVRGLQNITVPNTTFALYRITDNNIMYGYKGNDSDTDKKIQQSLESLVTEGKQITIKDNTTGNNLDQHPAVPVIDSITVDKDFPQQAGTELNVKANVRGPEGMQIKFVVGDLNGNEYVRQDFSNKTEAKVSFNTTGSKRIIVVVKYNDNGVNKFIRGSIFFQIVAKSDKIDAKDLEKPLQVVQNTPTIYDDQPSPNTEEKNVYNQTNLVKENLNGVEYVNSYTTGEDGSLSVNDLPYGYYFFVEEKVDVPCVQDTTPIIFKINSQGKTLEYTMHNDTVTEFEITKTDVSDGRLLPNTEFAIYADDKTTVVDSGVTDENGIAKFWLTPGTYYYQEIKAPEGYQIDTGLYEFTINDDDTIVRAHMTNSKQGFIITKTDVSDGTLLPNTEFAIYKEDKTTIIETGITDEKGEAKFSLGTGTYYYQEIKAPEGYQIDNKLYQFVIKENDEIVRAHMTDSKLPKTGTVFTKDNLPLEITLVVIGVSGLALFLARRKARK